MKNNEIYEFMQTKILFETRLHYYENVAMYSCILIKHSYKRIKHYYAGYVDTRIKEDLRSLQNIKENH
jgi:hypothetical protein